MQKGETYQLQTEFYSLPIINAIKLPHKTNYSRYEMSRLMARPFQAKRNQN